METRFPASGPARSVSQVFNQVSPSLPAWGSAVAREEGKGSPQTTRARPLGHMGPACGGVVVAVSKGIAAGL